MVFIHTWKIRYKNVTNLVLGEGSYGGVTLCIYIRTSTIGPNALPEYYDGKLFVLIGRGWMMALAFSPMAIIKWETFCDAY